MENKGEIVVYQPDDITRLEVRIEHDSVWLTQAQIAELFQRDRTVVTRHIKNVFDEHELEEKSNVHFLHFANSDKPVKYYILSIDYRVKSSQGVTFRKWFAFSLMTEWTAQDIIDRIQNSDCTIS